MNHISEEELAILIKRLNLDGLESPPSSQDEDVSRERERHWNGHDGWITIQDQMIIVSDPGAGGRRAVIGALPPVKLTVNGEAVTAQTEVSANSRIVWSVAERPLFAISVTEDKLQAHFQLRSRQRHAWRLTNTEKLREIIVTAVEDTSIVLETVHLSDVAAALQGKGIKANLDMAAIQWELESPSNNPVVIARGRAPLPGQDARLELYFAQEVENQFYEVGGAVDFRNHLFIPSVKRGEIIARKYPLREGVPGYDVFGQVIVPPEPRDVIVVAKNNVELSASGEAIALREGRPRITGGVIKTLDISTAYVVQGNVDMKTGNIVFSGDIVVYGDVTDNMIVESLGNVYVYGSVYNATMTATGSIHVRGNIIGSRLYSGYYGVLFNRLYHTTHQLHEKVGLLLAAADLLMQALHERKQTVRYSQILLLLLENKFKDISGALKELLTVISNIQHLKKEEYRQLKEMAEVFFAPMCFLETATASYMRGFLALLGETHREVERMQEDKAQTVINQCHNSELKSNGDIVILRDGVIQSDLFSARNIMFKHENAVCRGSHLEAQDSIDAKIIGGQTGGRSVLKASRQVTVRRMYFGRVYIGKFGRDISEIIDNMTFTINNMK